MKEAVSGVSSAETFLKENLLSFSFEQRFGMVPPYSREGERGINSLLSQQKPVLCKVQKTTQPSREVRKREKTTDKLTRTVNPALKGREKHRTSRNQ